MLKEGLEQPTKRIAKLPLDERGYPVPWFVSWIDGKPEFRAMDLHKWIAAIKESRCWICGDILGANKVFVSGLMCGINRTSSEPPSHLDCAQWAARNCPFLVNPKMVRRECEKYNKETYAEGTAGIALSRNPGVVMLWITPTFDVFKDPNDKPLIHMGEPVRVEWWREGRLATRAEVLESVESGLPALERLANQQAGGMEYLEKCKKRFEKWLPMEETEHATP